MADKKPNRIQSLLDTETPKSRGPLARELGEEDENPAEMGDSGGDDDAKREIGSKVRMALEQKDDLALYKAICEAYEFEEGGSSPDSGPEDAEAPYAPSS